VPGAREIDFYLGLGSRYSYLAASQVDRIEKTHGCRFVWKPIASGALMDRRGGNPFREPVGFRVDPAMLALACLAADEQGASVRCCRLLQHLIFVEGVAIDDDVIAGLPTRLGLDPARFSGDLDKAHPRHEALLDEARRHGAFGVPTFFLGERMFWGNDRLVLLEAA
jgi:2-hydroxychromene-2-carboxylate isomerase